MSIVSFACLVYALIVKPYSNNCTNLLLMFNDGFLLLICISLFLFVNPMAHYFEASGWGLFGVLAFYIGTNVVLLVA